MSLDTEVGLPKRSRVRGPDLQDAAPPGATPQAVRASAWSSTRHGIPSSCSIRGHMMKNPVMFLVEVGTLLTALVTVQSIVNGAATGLIVYQASLTLLLL